MPEACATAIYENLKRWCAGNGTGRPPARKLVTQTVSRRHVKTEKVAQRRCPQHGGKVESVYPNFVLAPLPISLLPV